MDLAFSSRIDTDPGKLVLLDNKPTGSPVHDRVLDRVASSSEAGDTKTWIQTIARFESADIRNQALPSLIDKNILESQEEKFP